MSTATPRTASIFLLTCLALTLGACSNQNTGHSEKAHSKSGGKSDHAALQGRWEQLPDQPGGSGTPRQRVVKEVSGDTETVTTYGPNGQVLRQQTATVRLSRSGPVHVYTARDLRVTGGSGGEASPESVKYVYRVHGNEFDEVWGLLPGQEEREVIVKRWRREGSSQ